MTSYEDLFVTFYYVCKLIVISGTGKCPWCVICVLSSCNVTLYQTTVGLPCAHVVVIIH